MRAVVQRVKSASVSVDGKVISSTGPGLLCLIGIKTGDTEADQDYLCRKILSCKLWPSADSGRAWSESIVVESCS
ncbi:hypothetical protein WJX81_001855 [Elliptochloris bilobata]|uniref:D-aminoacyl-tRNA deacylase n=1 Tax=Elliptochloris bilobata TaxID=381761 RepID=A0AAW1RAZ8_9CHLO